jgi:hypothetical protein
LQDPSKIYPIWDFWFQNKCTIWQPCAEQSRIRELCFQCRSCHVCTRVNASSFDAKFLCRWNSQVQRLARVCARALERPILMSFPKSRIRNVTQERARIGRQNLSKNLLEMEPILRTSELTTTTVQCQRCSRLESYSKYVEEHTGLLVEL